MTNRERAIQEVMSILGHLTECCLDETVCQRLATDVVDDAIIK